MLVKIVLVVMAMLVAGLVEKNQATSSLEPRIESCLRAVEEKITEVIIPEEIRNFGLALRSLNPNLNSLSLNKIIDDKSANLDVVGEGIVTLDQIDSLLDKCNVYADNLGPIMNGSACGERLIEQIESKMPDGFENLEERLGHAKVCLGKVILVSPLVRNWLYEKHLKTIE